MAKTCEPIEAQRSIKRTRVLMRGMLMTPVGAHQVTIRDISSTGARVFSPESILSNCDAVLKRGSLFAAAQIAWSHNRQAGLWFYRELTPAELDSQFHPVLFGTDSGQ